ncbi:MAG: Rab family GTPase [Promethearchaeota archaeon]
MPIYHFKVLLLGAPSVGKTSILYRYVKDKFSLDYILTIGINFLTKEVNVAKKNRTKLVIWDIGGQKRFKFLHKEFYEGTNGALVIFDLTRYNTFEEIEEWLSEMFEILNEEIPFIIIGNKSDLVQEISHSVDSNLVREYAEKKNSLYIETSAKTGENITEAFHELAQRMISHVSKK